MPAELDQTGSGNSQAGSLGISQPATAARAKCSAPGQSVCSDGESVRLHSFPTSQSSDLTPNGEGGKRDAGEREPPPRRRPRASALQPLGKGLSGQTGLHPASLLSGSSGRAPGNGANS